MSTKTKTPRVENSQENYHPSFYKSQANPIPSNEYECLPVPYLLISKSGDIHYQNLEATRIFGLNTNAQPEFSIFDLIPPDFQTEFIALLEAAKTASFSQSSEMTFVAFNGKTIQTKIHINVHSDGQTREDVFRLVITDIADLMQMFDQQLLESESKYRDLAENINEGIYLAERGFITMVNTPLLNIFGETREEVIGKKVWQFVVPEKRAAVRDLFLKKVEMMDTTPVEVECLRKNKERFWAEIKVSIFKDQHKVFGVLSNITDRKKVELALKDSEQKYRSVVTAMNDGIILRDTNGRVIAWNSAAEKILNLNPDEIKSLLSIHPEWKAIREDGSAFPAELHPAVITLKTGKPEQNVVMGIHNSKGQLKWITINSEPIFGEEATLPSAVVTSFSDITGLKKSENKLRELNAIKDKLFSIIAHDLKSPYNAQMGFLELLMEENLNYTIDQRKHFVRMLYESARQSFALLDNLLVWSRTQTGRIPFNPVEISIDELIKSTMNFYQLAASVKQISLKTAHNGGHLKVKADYEMVNTVLRNLISNAIKFTPTGGKVTVSCKSIDNGQLKIAIQDTGTGISEHLIGRLFTSHEIHSTPGTENEKGTGLGLIICKEFVERNGGEIWAESKPGKGSSFYFTLKNAAIQQKCAGTCMTNILAVYEHISSFDDLRQEFEQTIAASFRGAFKSLDKISVREFAEQLTQIVEKYKLEELNEFISNFSYECIERDINQVNICFSEFEKLIDKIEMAQQMRQK
ncbi:MAG: PAS domain-containing sensor histidine kinase [Bacteroidales bacterium]|nr:PAS domain-containing sensor histidine kinase [Bacteroidales bacterium]